MNVNVMTVLMVVDLPDCFRQFWNKNHEVRLLLKLLFAGVDFWNASS